MSEFNVQVHRTDIIDVTVEAGSRAEAIEKARTKVNLGDGVLQDSTYDFDVEENIDPELLPEEKIETDESVKIKKNVLVEHFVRSIEHDLHMIELQRETNNKTGALINYGQAYARACMLSLIQGRETMYFKTLTKASKWIW